MNKRHIRTVIKLADELLAQRSWQDRESNFQNFEWQNGVKALRNAIINDRAP